MGKKFDFDYIIIGSGPAGSTVATNLAKARKKVALVEGHNFGGSDINTRDIPYRASLGFSHLYSSLVSDAKFGLSKLDLHFNFPTIINRQERVVANIGSDARKNFEELGITCIRGYANLLDKTTVAVGNQQFTARRIILATGAKLSVDEISGTDTVDYLTPAAAIKVRRIPKAVLVVGGGSAGCEIAEYFAELGAKVLIMEKTERLLPREDQEVDVALSDYFTNHLGMLVLKNSRVVALEQDTLSKRVIFVHEGREKMVRVDTIVLATGSQPNLDYGLENAGIKYKKTGIVVDKTFQTSTKNIFAIGDAIGGESSTERANYQGTLLTNNLLGKSKNIANYNGFIRVTKTLPEVATVGLNEYDLFKRDRKFRKKIVYLSETTAGKITGFEKGFVKLLADGNNRIIGATVVAPEAEILAHELALAVRHHLSALEIASTPHNINSYNAAVRLAARQLITKKK